MEAIPSNEIETREIINVQGNVRTGPKSGLDAAEIADSDTSEHEGWCL